MGAVAESAVHDLYLHNADVSVRGADTGPHGLTEGEKHPLCGVRVSHITRECQGAAVAFAGGGGAGQRSGFDAVCVVQDRIAVGTEG